MEMDDECKKGAYCILEGVLQVGLRLLAGCCILYLNKGEGYCIFCDIFGRDFLDVF